MLRRTQHTFRTHQPRIERNGGHVVLAQVVRHTRGHAIVGGLGHPIDYAAVVFLRREEGDIHDQAGSFLYHQRCCQGAAEIVRPHSRLEHGLPARERHCPEALLRPECRAVPEVLVAAPYVVDKDVEASVVGGDSREQGAHLSIVAVIAADGNAMATTLVHLLDGLVDGSRQTSHATPLTDCATCDVNCSAGLGQPEGHALADTPARPRY